MDTNAALRKRAWRLVNLGVSQKAIAIAMGMKESTFSKWLNNRPGINAPRVDALDGFNLFVLRLSDEASDDLAHLPERDRERLEDLRLTQQIEPEMKEIGRRAAAVQNRQPIKKRSR